MPGKLVPPDDLVLRLAMHLRSLSLAEGMAIPSESDLMAAMNIGRQQLREGLRVLEGFGAIEVRQGARRRWRGFKMGELVSLSAQLVGSPKETVAELLVIRQALETSMLARVMALLTREDLDGLLHIAQSMERRARDGKSFADLDAKFHLSLFAPLQNAALETILGAFWTLLDINDRDQQFTTVEPVVAEMHTAIVIAILDGDYDLAVHELDTHFYDVRRRILSRNLRSQNVTNTVCSVARYPLQMNANR